MLLYYTGEEVLKGDFVRCPGLGVGEVDDIVEPGTEDAASWNLPKGGIVIHFKPDGKPVQIWAMDDLSNEEDWEFVGRKGTVSSLTIG